MSSDEALYQQIRHGDISAFDVLYLRYEKRLFQFIFGYLKNQQESEDAFHDAFMEVLKSREVRFDRATFCTWIYRIARNRCLNQLRSCQRQGTAYREAPLHLSEQAKQSDDLLAAQQRDSLLNRAVAALPAHLIEVYRLRNLEMSYEEMAEVLDIPIGTVKSRIHEMVNHLKEGLRVWTAS